MISVTGSLASTIGKYNPFRYRSYYYDTETGWYYLQSRYYDPTVGRFINADGIIGANGDLQAYNMFAYCSNNPVMGYDPYGYMATALADNAYGEEPLEGLPTGSSGGWILGVALASAATYIIAKYSTESLPKKYHLEKKANAEIPELGEYYVYVLKQGDDIQYVGRTKNIKAREIAHRNSANRGNLEMVVVASNLTYGAARGLEQILMLEFHTLNTLNEANNQINGISPYNDLLDVYMAAGRGILEYFDNQISNEILNWTGQ